jgi:hypothetical protein
MRAEIPLATIKAAIREMIFIVVGPFAMEAYCTATGVNIMWSSTGAAERRYHSILHRSIPSP